MIALVPRLLCSQELLESLWELGVLGSRLPLKESVYHVGMGRQSSGQGMEPRGWNEYRGSRKEKTSRRFMANSL